MRVGKKLDNGVGVGNKMEDDGVERKMEVTAKVMTICELYSF